VQSVITTHQLMGFLSDGFAELFKLQLVRVGLGHGKLP